eukprot:1082045_1
MKNLLYHWNIITTTIITIGSITSGVSRTYADMLSMTGTTGTVTNTGHFSGESSDHIYVMWLMSPDGYIDTNLDETRGRGSEDGTLRLMLITIRIGMISAVKW